MSVESVRSVHWHEGMFLWPHQMQLAERHYGEQLRRQHKWDVHFDWGLRTFDWEPKDLATARFVVRSLRARFRDGTLVSVPEDAALASLDLKPALERTASVMVYLAIPKAQKNKANVAERVVANGDGDGVDAAQGADRRYLLDSFDFEDENTGDGAQPIQVRSLNVRLLLSTQDLAGYETLPIARIVRGGTGPEAPPELDESFIPPVLACDAWPVLQTGILRALFDRFGKKVDVLGKQVVSRGISFDTRNPGDNLLLGQLHTLNRAYGALNTVGFAEGLHPLTAYLELCRIAGQLAIFGDTRRVPTFPSYDHDDLGACFYTVKRYLESIPIHEPLYEERPFIGHQLAMRVQLEAEWMEPVWEVFVGVHSTLPPQDCIKMLTREGPLDMKIGSSTNIDTIYTGGFAGLEFTPSPLPPRALPTAADLVYFQINRTSRREEWERVRACLALAIRVNPRRLYATKDGRLDEQRELMVQTSDRQPATMRFTLFLVRREQ